MYIRTYVCKSVKKKKNRFESKIVFDYHRSFISSRKHVTQSYFSPRTISHLDRFVIYSIDECYRGLRSVLRVRLAHIRRIKSAI